MQDAPREIFPWRQIVLFECCVYSAVTAAEDIRTAYTTYRIMEHDCLEKVVWYQFNILKPKTYFMYHQL
jgi:hypothetical protein